ncbi:MAG TPA: zinc-dependent metalloprotease family protein [Polyangiaceae bacterium]
MLPFTSPHALRVLLVVSSLALLAFGCKGDDDDNGDGAAETVTQTSAGGSAAGSAGSSGDGGSGGQATGGSSAETSSQGGSGDGGSSTQAGANGGTSGAGCEGGLDRCGDTCIDTRTSTAHCGACDNRCRDAELCVDGACSATCDPPRTVCDDTCTDLEIDAANCGACGARCGRGTPCVRGTCGCPEDSVACAGACVDPLTDADNCGKCGTPCAGDAICVEGRCECAPGTTVCGSSCVSLLDPEHCGGCDRSCDDDEICAEGECVAAGDPCPEGTTRCGSACVDTDTSPSHCGGCNQPCGGTQFCEDGACGCSEGRVACGTACVDTSSSPVHCGDCGNVCAVGQVCEEGECVCSSSATTDCDGVCVDTGLDPNNCGGCGTECGEYPCTDGECACPEGEELCDGACVNVESNAQHCGGCGDGCANDESCILGECSDDVDDGCSNTLAGDIELSEIALYQAGKVSVMSAGTSVAAGDRVADVIVGKTGLLRASVTLDAAFSARVLSARLVVVNGDDATAFFHKRSVSVASSDASPATTFNFPLDAELIQSDTSYSVELVECGAPTGSVMAPRFPSGGTEALLARDVGQLRIEYVPIIANGNTPRTSAAQLDVLTNYIREMYPVSRVEVSVGLPMTANRSIGVEAGWEEVLQQLSQRHATNMAPNDLYYYGLLEPEDTYDEFCSSGCTLGLGYVAEASASDRHFRVSMGLSYGDTYSAETAAHEIGHNFGRDHAPCGGPGYPDPEFPHAGARIGWWGFTMPDVLLSPSVTRDIMSYCEDPWISDYTYQALAERAAIINASSGALSTLPIGRWRVVVASRGGSVWGVPFDTPVSAAGTPEGATILDRFNHPIAQITVYRKRMGNAGSSSVMVPEPEAGWYALQLNGDAPLAFDGKHQTSP